MFALDTDAESVSPPGMLIWRGPHDYAKGAVDSRYEVPEGCVIRTRWFGRLHCVIYQCPRRSEFDRKHYDAILFSGYGDGNVWNEVVDNGFGKTYRRGDMKRFALWSYALDYNTFGTMAFHAVMWN